MQDLTKITTPFGLLDKETRKALMDHEGPIEYYAGKEKWVEVHPCWVSNKVYRAKKQPREIWVNEYADFNEFNSLYADEQEARCAAEKYGAKRTVKFVEEIK